MYSKYTKPEAGISLLEFAVALSILLVIFLTFRVLLSDGTDKRYQESLKTDTSPVPCGGNITGDDCR